MYKVIIVETISVMGIKAKENTVLGVYETYTQAENAGLQNTQHDFDLHFEIYKV